MKSGTMRFTVLVSFCILALCVFLLPSTLAMLQVYDESDIGPGVVPFICIAGISVLTVYTLIVDLLQQRRQRAGGLEAGREVGEGELDKSFLGVACISIVLMALYALLWAYSNFLVGSLFFSGAMAFLCIPRTQVSPRGMAVIFGFLGLFVVGVWFVFVKLLGVSLG